MPNQSNSTSLRPFLAALAAVVAVWALSGLALFGYGERGTFGDMFGAVNSLFSGLAFAALIYTVLLQRRELQLQREELALTRLELEGQKIQMIAQNDVLRQQNFESTFFQTLSVLSGIVIGMDMGTSEKPVKGRDCFGRLLRTYKARLSQPTAAAIADPLEKCKSAYADFYLQFGHEVGHYFRTLYNLVKLVDRSEVKDKRFYTNLVRAQLSDNELGLLFYNCLSPLGSEKFKPLVERYALLKNLPSAFLADKEHQSMYTHSAYE